MSANQISVFLDPAKLPFRTQEQETFDELMGQFMQNLPVFGAQFNAAVALFNASMAGGVYALPYMFDSATADADPGPNTLRLSSATQNSAATLRLDLTAGNQDVTALLDMFDASTSNVKGSIRLVKMGDMSKWLTFDVTARSAPTGYRNMTVVNTGSSSATPFAAGDAILLFFQRNGDAGSLLPGATELLATYKITSAISIIDFLSVFNNALYGKYTIEIEEFLTPAAPNIQMAVAGAPLTAASYWPMLTDGASTSAVTNFQLGYPTTNGPASFLNATLEVRGAGTTTSAKAVGMRGSWTYGGAYMPIIREGGLTPNQGALTGFRLNTGGATSGTIRVYGHRK